MLLEFEAVTFILKDVVPFQAPSAPPSPSLTLPPLSEQLQWLVSAARGSCSFAAELRASAVLS